jgi:DNA polymerase III sliding clamp (beta) subunit (PCNA family)
MKSKKRQIREKVLNWLWSAISVNDVQFLHIGKNGAMSSDGARMHLVNVEELVKDDGGLIVADKTIAQITELRNSNDEDEVSFYINAQYLKDALSVFEHKVEIKLVGSVNINQRIIINDPQTNDNEKLTAVIMCVTPPEGK